MSEFMKERRYYPPRIIEMHKRIREVEAEIVLSKMPTIVREFLYRNRVRREGYDVAPRLHYIGMVSIAGHESQSSIV